MELKEVILCLIDISGYTRFLQWNRTSLLHAEEIITTLLEAVISSARYPLRLNKLEGDAALLYTPVQADPLEIALDVLKQAQDFFTAFHNQQQELIATRNCPCDVCQSVADLQLKVFLHHGPVIIKHVRQFEELAGEPVILIHRLLKTELQPRKFLLLSEAFYHLIGGAPELQLIRHQQHYEDLGELASHVFFPGGVPAETNMPGRTPSSVRKPNWLELLQHRLFRRRKPFHHLPY